MPQNNQTFVIWSRAIGSHRYGSDIDISLDGDELTIDDLLKLHSRIDDLNLPSFIDLVHIQRMENPDLIGHITLIGKIIYCH